MLFLPPYLKEAFSKATITGPDGTIRPLVSETHVIGAGEADEPEKDIWDLFTPLVCAWLLFGIVLGLTWIEWRKVNKMIVICSLLQLFYAKQNNSDQIERL